MLEERIDDEPGAFSGFAFMDRVIQRFWSHRYIDEILSMREDTRDSTGAIGADGDFFNAAGFYFLCDRKYDVIAVLRDNGAASLIERVRYTPYGVARHEPASDMDGDGSVSSTELLAILPLLGTPFTSPNYNPDLDVDRDGQINTSDYLAVLANFAAGVAEGKVSTVHNIIAYSGYVYDEAVDLDLSRYRWFDPGMGRWISRDPLEYVDSHDLYEYVRSAPTTTLDSDGRFLFVIGALTTGVGIERLIEFLARHRNKIRDLRRKEKTLDEMQDRYSRMGCPNNTGRAKQCENLAESIINRQRELSIDAFKEAAECVKKVPGTTFTPFKKVFEKGVRPPGE